jgi:hypothetical protein
MQDKQVELLTRTGDLEVLSPDDVLKRLRWPPGSNPTTWEQRFREIFLQEFPEQAANVQQYQEKPGCSCRKPLLAHVSLKHETVTALLAKAFGAKIYAVQNVPQAPEKRTPQMAGSFALVDPNPAAYSLYFQSIHKMGGKQYNGVSVMPTTDEAGRAKWALLFW